VQIIVADDGAAQAREVIAELTAIGVRHVVVGSRRQYRPGGMRWLLEEVVRPAHEISRI
jgi:hypothetical protein